MLRYRTGVAGSYAAGLAAALYLSSEYFRPENEQLARYYAGEIAPSHELTGMDFLGKAINDGDVSFGDALDALVSAQVRLFGAPADIDGLEERVAARLIDAADKADKRDAGAAQGGTVAKIRQDLDPRLAERLGIDMDRPITHHEIANLLTGLRCDGEKVVGKQVQKPMRSITEIFGLEEKAMPAANVVEMVLAGRRADGDVPMDTKGVPLPAAIVQGAQKRFLAAYGMPSGQEPTAEQIDRIKAGRTVTGVNANTSDVMWKLNATKQPVAFVDMIWSADKSVACAWALGPSAAEQSMILQAHDDAVAFAMRYAGKKLGFARRGANSEERQKGSMCWLSFNHYTSRPTAEIARTDADGQRYTEFKDVPMRVADPLIHSHCPLLNAVMTPDGHIGAMDLDELDGLVKRLGGVYQARLAKNLRAHGIETKLDKETGAARIIGIPDRVRDHFSKRTRDVHAAAKALAEDAGKDWDTMSGEQQLALLRKGVEVTRNRKNDRDGASDFAEWRKQAEQEIGYHHRSVLRPNEITPELEDPVRRQLAYEVSLDLIEDALSKKAKLGAEDFREFAVRGLVEAGIGDDPDADINAIMRLYRDHGVRQNGKMTSIVFGKDVPVRGKERWSVTTEAHEIEERKVVALAKEFAADKSTALPAAALEKAKRDFLASRPFIDPNGASWKEQSAAIDHLSSARFCVAIGAAGVGKTTLLTPIVAAGRAEGRKVVGLATAWKIAAALRSAGIDRKDFSAIDPFVRGAGKWKLDKNTIVIVDELSQVARSDMLRLMELQQKHGFMLMAVGDPKQCAAVKSGPTISLLQDALGNAIPEVLISNRQRTEREAAIASLFREDGGAGTAEAIAMKRQDKTAELVAGGRDPTIKRVAALWRERIEARSDEPDFKLTVSTPTNADAHDIGQAIRKEMRAMGRLGEDAITVTAAMRGEPAQKLVLASGDKVRLFNRVFAEKTMYASNGDVVTVLKTSKDGLKVRNDEGKEAFLEWRQLQPREGGAPQIAYGYATTTDAAQGITSDEHIDALPDGSRMTQGLKGYVAESRQRDTTWLVVNEAAERKQIAGRIPIGEYRPIRDDDIWNNVIANLGKQPIKAGALDFLKHGSEIQRGAIAALPAALERRDRAGQNRSTVRDRIEELRAAARDATPVLAQARVAQRQAGHGIEL